MENTTILKNNSIYSGTYQVISHMQILNEKFEKLNISGSKLENNHFENVHFVNCHFQGTAILETNFIDCTFENCTFYSARLESCNFVACKFDHCSFYITNSLTCNFLSCTLLNNNWKACSLNGCFHLCFIQDEERAQMNITADTDFLPLSSQLEVCVA